MSVAPEKTQPPAAEHHAPPRGFINRWIFSKDHKIIGIQYYFLALVAVFMGMGIFIALVQTFVFTLLSILYITFALEEAH